MRTPPASAASPTNSPSRTELTSVEYEDVRHQAIAYVEAVVARAEGAPAAEPAEPPARPRPSPGRLVPGFVKRAIIRSLIHLNRHPFDHLSHPLRVEVEHRLAELRASVHAANHRADQAYHAVNRARPELESWRRAVNAALADVEEDLRSLRARLDELERRS